MSKGKKKKKERKKNPLVGGDNDIIRAVFYEAENVWCDAMFLLSPLFKDLDLLHQFAP